MIFTIILYILINTYWCSVGLRWFAPSLRGTLYAAMLGVVRTLLWWIFGLFVLYTSLFLQGVFQNAAEARTAVYIFLYIPSVWIQWCVIARLIGKKKSSWKEILFGASWKQYRWRLYGTIISLIVEFPNTFLWSILLQQMYERGGN